ncbi:transcription elongation factor GreA [Oscillospiraceae bacterium HV4-5-C5C]|nr:transcription elongation factor GreA [Oscillospiraceae bacterium HV4-5-C5C]
MAEKVYELTVEGLNHLKDELDNRKVVRRGEISDRIKVALSFGDLSENSEYDDAKQAQGENEARIAEIEDILKNARVIDGDEISKTNVTLGCQVTLLDTETNETEVYKLVSPKEEDILLNKISSESPVGTAILGKKKNQVAQVKTPSGVLKYKILKIEIPHEN